MLNFPGAAVLGKGGILKLETTSVTINIRMDKFCVYSYNGILYSNEKEWTVDPYNNINELSRHYFVRRQTQKSANCMIPLYEVREQANLTCTLEVRIMATYGGGTQKLIAVRGRGKHFVHCCCNKERSRERDFLSKI